MHEKEQLGREAMAQEFYTNDIHRRKILFTSMQGKLASAKLMLFAAIDAANDAKLSYAQGDQGAAERNAEAIFAAVEEVLQSLSIVKTLSVKAGCNRPIPPMTKYQNSVASLDQPGSENSAFAN